MTFFIEICGPWQWRPGFFRSRVMTRMWWGYVAIGWMPTDLYEFAQNREQGYTEWEEYPHIPGRITRGY